MNEFDAEGKYRVKGGDWGRLHLAIDEAHMALLNQCIRQIACEAYYDGMQEGLDRAKTITMLAFSEASPLCKA